MGVRGFLVTALIPDWQSKIRRSRVPAFAVTVIVTVIAIAILLSAGFTSAVFIVAAFVESPVWGVGTLIFLIWVWVLMLRPKHGAVLGSAKRLVQLGVAFGSDGQPSDVELTTERAIRFTTGKYGDKEAGQVARCIAWDARMLRYGRRFRVKLTELEIAALNKKGEKARSKYQKRLDRRTMSERLSLARRKATATRTWRQRRRSSTEPRSDGSDPGSDRIQ